MAKRHHLTYPSNDRVHVMSKFRIVEDFSVVEYLENLVHKHLWLPGGVIFLLCVITVVITTDQKLLSFFRKLKTTV